MRQQLGGVGGERRDGEQAGEAVGAQRAQQRALHVGARLAARARAHGEHGLVLVRQVRARREHGAQQEAAARLRVGQQVVVAAGALGGRRGARGVGGARGARRREGPTVTWGARGGRQVGRGAAEARVARARRQRRGGGAGAQRQLRARALVHGGRAPRLALHAVRRHWGQLSLISTNFWCIRVLDSN